MEFKNSNPIEGLNILLCVSGSIAAVKTPILLSNLIKKKANVRCLLSESASKLVSPLSLSTLSRSKCYLDQDQWDRSQSKPLHIALSEWADVIAISPLSASTLAKYVHGIADNLLVSTLIASEVPIIAAPAMNTSMWENEAVKRNWNTLSENKKFIKLNPNYGLLACDRTGEGKMASPEVIELAIQSAVINSNENNQPKNDLINQNFLITTGSTIEEIDLVRQISNKSSGYMGILMAQAARFRGANVNLIYSSIKANENLLEGLEVYKVNKSSDLESKVIELSNESDFICMVAAISDIRIKSNYSKKLEKKSLFKFFSENIELTPDILKNLSANKRTSQLIMGFTALTGDDEEIMRLAIKKMNDKSCDLIFANPIDRPHQGFGESLNGGFLIGRENFCKKFDVDNKFTLANKLIDEMLSIKNKNL